MEKKNRIQQPLTLKKIKITLLNNSIKLTIKGGKEGNYTTDIDGSDTSIMTQDTQVSFCIICYSCLLYTSDAADD